MSNAWSTRPTPCQATQFKPKSALSKRKGNLPYPQVKEKTFKTFILNVILLSIICDILTMLGSGGNASDVMILTSCHCIRIN